MKAVFILGTAEILSKIFWPEGPKIFGEKFVLVTKSKVKPCYI